MKLKYLGTAAAEAFPALFCRCDTCMRARKSGGKDIRGRSGILIDGTHLIDFPPDIHFNTLRLGIGLFEVKDLFITHSHLDHFAPGELMMRDPVYYCRIAPDEKMEVYGDAEVGRLLREAITREFPAYTPDFCRFTQIEYYAAYATGGLRFIPLPADHKPDEKSAIYLIEGGSRRFLYAHDTGHFPQATFRYLEGRRLSGISLDCCFGLLESAKGHMVLSENLRVLEKLLKQGIAVAGTSVVISHFSHNCGSLQQELEAEAEKYGIEAAFDGKELEL